jgi:protein-tyrosine phosphatase
MVEKLRQDDRSEQMPEPESDPFKVRMTGVTQHQRISFDVPVISHIEGNLYQGGCMSGLVLPERFEHVVSLYPWEQYAVRHQPRSYMLFWLLDATEIPSIVFSIAEWVQACVGDGPTLVHCQAGLNRSSLITALVLIQSGMSGQAAIKYLREKRSPAVLCNTTFAAWVEAQ